MPDQRPQQAFKRGFMTSIVRHAMIVRHTVHLARWSGPEMRVGILTDPHVGVPWTSLDALGTVVEQLNDQKPDLIVLLGDYLTSRKLPSRRVPILRVAQILARLRAPLGVFAVQGNHDWWDDPAAQLRRAGPTVTQEAFAEEGLAILQNQALALEHEGQRFWLGGLESQQAFGRRGAVGLDDLPAVLAVVTDDAPLLLMAHEPDLFTGIDPRVDLMMSGHTHGGQINLFGYRPISPSRHHWGHFREGVSQLVVSGGVGHSVVPLRVMARPELTIIEISSLPK